MKIAITEKESFSEIVFSAFTQIAKITLRKINFNEIIIERIITVVSRVAPLFKNREIPENFTQVFVMYNENAEI